MFEVHGDFLFFCVSKGKRYKNRTMACTTSQNTVTFWAHSLVLLTCCFSVLHSAASQTSHSDFVPVPPAACVNPSAACDVQTFLVDLQITKNAVKAV